MDNTVAPITFSMSTLHRLYYVNINEAPRGGIVVSVQQCYVMHNFTLRYMDHTLSLSCMLFMFKFEEFQLTGVRVLPSSKIQHYSHTYKL